LFSGSIRKSCLALLCSLLAPVAVAHTVEGIRIWSEDGTTRVVLDVTGPVEHRIFMLDDPERLVIDLERTRLAADFSATSDDGLVRRVRTGVRSGGDCRVVLDLEGAVRPKSFLLTPNGRYGHRLVVDLSAAGARAVEIRPPAARGSRGRDLVIAIDAGHGGKDPGASGPKGVREKDVVLQIARRLASELEQYPGFEPLLVRNGDAFLTLRGRTEIARRAAADFFISIHADAYRNEMARGATIYALSQKGATDEAAQRLADRENAADLIGGVSLSEQDQMIATVLLDLTQSAAISASLSAGDDIIRELSAVARLRKSTVQQAGFTVLKSPDIPSILVETAYLSNPNEEAALRSADHQSKLARALSKGIVRYFYDNPPPDTYVAMNADATPREPVRHSVTRGETLSGIAQRYRVSLDRLRISNQLKSDRIRIGQVLMIPRG
jgi:N-acetylmuramoyl-L-alanine amidase